MIPRRVLLVAIVPFLMAPQDCGHTRPTCDSDHDGQQSVDCGGNDCADDDDTRFPGNTEVCDVAGHDEDCDPTTFGGRDADADGYVDANCCNRAEADAGTWMVCGLDCNDTAPGSHPDQNESCNGIDDDCDTAIDEAVLMNVYLDYDQDGHGTGVASQACALIPGFSYLSNDCDDKNPAILPGAMQCSGASYVLCGSDGQWSAPASCTVQATCHVQPNATGVCW